VVLVVVVAAAAAVVVVVRLPCPKNHDKNISITAAVL